MRSIETIKKPVLLPDELTDILPVHLLSAIRNCGAKRAEELRLHKDRTATVSCFGRNHSTGVVLREDEIGEILRKMCGGSLYAYHQTINQGFLTMSGGIRVGICGSAALENGKIIGVNHVSGLVIRIPHPPEVQAQPILQLLQELNGRGILIYSPPGAGKTTLLRASAVQASGGTNALRTVVVDTREELFPALDGEDLLLDVLIGYPKDTGIGIAVRCLGAQLIICDEIGDTQDADAILHAANCGVPLLASAHASRAEELLRRPAIRTLHRAEVFGAYVGIQRTGDGTFRYCVNRCEDFPHDNI